MTDPARSLSDRSVSVDRDAAEYWMGVSIAADAEVALLRAENENYERCLHATEEKAIALQAENEALRKRTCLCAYRGKETGPIFPSVAELQAEVERLREALTATAITTCREWCDEKADHCHAPAEFLIWGKLIPPNGLGPRCYDHAAEHVGHRALGDPSWAIVDLRPARSALQTDETEAPRG